jgi:outer membrane protein assembly factor BamB
MRSRPAHASLIVALTLLVAACGGSGGGSGSGSTPKPSGPPPSASGSWPYPNADLANTRVAPGSTISSQNVTRLRQAWTFKLSGSAAKGVDGAGALAMNPIVSGGVVYIQDLDANVYAVALATGKLEWEHQFNQPVKSGPGPNGVAVAGGVVYGDTAYSVFALNAHTGKTLWVDNHLLSTGQGSFEIQPEVAGGRVYVASAYGPAPGGGVLLALTASTGRVLWKFNTVTGAAPGVKALGLGAGGAWEPPLVGADGSVTFGIGNPYQSLASAIREPAPILYTDSAVNLDASTGKLRWYYQAVPDDFKDYDMQASPIATSVAGVPAIIGGGKMGYVYAMNAKTGKLIWKTPVGAHNGHDDDSLEMLAHRSTVAAPLTIEPGSLGGVLTNMALAGNSVYVATIDVALTYTSLSSPLPTKAAGGEGGEIEALDLATGKVEWDTKVDDLPLGAATVSNDLVFTTLAKGTLIALSRSTGAIVFRQRLPASTNAPIAIAGNTVLVPASALHDPGSGKGPAQLVAYTAP